MEKTSERSIWKNAQFSFSLIQAGFWMSFCISVSFAAVYLYCGDYYESFNNRRYIHYTGVAEAIRNQEMCHL